MEHYTSSLRTLVIHWIGEWVNPRVGLDVVTSRKFLTCHKLKLIIQSVASYETYRAIPVCKGIWELVTTWKKVINCYISSDEILMVETMKTAIF
jgi:hypothetical protein